MDTNEAEQARAITTALQMQVDEMTDEIADLRAKLDVAREALGRIASLTLRDLANLGLRQHDIARAALRTLAEQEREP